MNDAQLFYVHCRLTCLGGSEKGQCSCTRPDQCEARSHPKFSTYKYEAESRMVRFLESRLA